MIRYIDVHSHLSFPEFTKDREGVLDRMRKAQVGTATVGVDLSSSREAVSFSERHEGVAATVGLHPLDNRTESFEPETYRELVEHPNVVAVGECGLDYYRINPDDAEERKRQKETFRAQLHFAVEHPPLMVHGRPSKGTVDAYEDILSLLEEIGPSSTLTGNVHFFVGTLPIAERFFALNFTISFTGIITFARDFDEVIRRAPLQHLLAETDAPYAAPVPHRGRRNEPGYVPLVVECLADIRGEARERVREQLLQNTHRVFGSSAWEVAGGKTL